MVQKVDSVNCVFRHRIHNTRAHYLRQQSYKSVCASSQNSEKKRADLKRRGSRTSPRQEFPRAKSQGAKKYQRINQKARCGLSGQGISAPIRVSKISRGRRRDIAESRLRHRQTNPKVRFMCQVTSSETDRYWSFVIGDAGMPMMVPRTSLPWTQPSRTTSGPDSRSCFRHRTWM